MSNRYIFNPVRSVLLMLLAFLALTLPGAAWATAAIRPVAQATGCNAASDVGGVVFRDYNADGVQDLYEPGLIGSDAPITVTAYGAANQLLGVAAIDDYGDYTITGISLAGGVRIEFSGLPDWLQPGPHGGNSGTLVQFVGANPCQMNLGVNNPSDYCNAGPQLATTCLTNGNPLGGGSAGTHDALMAWPYAENGWSYAYPASTVGPGTAQAPARLAINSQIGPTWGIAYQRSTKTLFTSALLKRHAGFGPLGPSGIYAVDLSNPNVPHVQGFMQLNAPLYGVNVGPELPRPTLSVKAEDPSADPDVMPLLAKMSLGGLDIGEDDQTLYVMSLNNNGVLIEVNITGKKVLRQIPITDPGCTNGAAKAPQDSRPWAVKVHDGAVYVGVVCSAQTSQQKSDLRAYVMRLDGNAFTPIFGFALNYPKGIVSTDRPDSTNRTGWYPWTDNFATLFAKDTSRTEQTLMYPQPILSDIEFDADGSMILGFMDRTGQVGGRKNYGPNDTTPYNAHSGGDLLRVCKVNGKFVLEGGAGCPQHAFNNEGPGGGEFYLSDDYKSSGLIHYETSLGALALLPGSGEVVATHFDAVRHLQPGQIDTGQGDPEPRTGGVRFHRSTDGTVTHQYEIYPDTDNQTGTFAKAAGLGDLELLCDAAPIEIGNYVWRDSDGDGLQDPGEQPLAGVTVELLRDGNRLGQAQTDAAGQYYFSSAAGINTASAVYSITALIPYTTGYQVRIDLAQPALRGKATTSPNAGGIVSNDNKLDLNDSDGIFDGQYAAVAFSTEAAGFNNHNFDFGFKDAPPAVDIEKLTNGVQADQPDDPNVPQIAPGALVTWRYIITNTGAISIAQSEISVYDDIVGDLMLAGVLQPNANWAANGNGDKVLAPAEAWTLTVAQSAPDLSDPTQTSGLNLVLGCDATGARATYKNVATVSVSLANGLVAADVDASHFCNPPPPPPPVDIRIKKAVNGIDADLAPGPPFVQGAPLTWSYIITNTGAVVLQQITVTDDKIDAAKISCSASGALPPGKSMICTATDTAVEGPYQNRGTVTAQTASGIQVSDSDFAHYLGLPIPPVLDWGDAPDDAVGVGANNYQTVHADGGPHHTVVPDLYIGGGVDAEIDGQPTPQARGDDLAQFDDEDGIGNNACFVLGQPLQLDIPVFNSREADAQLSGWIDFDGNGAFAAAEQQYAVIASGPGSPIATLDFGRPPLSTPPQTFLRLRLSTDANAAGQPTGPTDPAAPTPDGEVEDHALRFVTPTLTSDVTRIVRNIGQEAVLNIDVVAACGSVEALPICVDITNDAEPAVCQPLPSDGRFAFTYSRPVTGTDQVAIWADLNADQVLSPAEPQVALPVIWQKAEISVETRINNRREPSPPGPELFEGDAISWTHTVFNSGSVELTNIDVTDGAGGAVICTYARLTPGASTVCPEFGAAQRGQHRKTVVAYGHIAGSQIVSNSDATYYTGIPPLVLDWGDAPDPTDGTGFNNYQTRQADNGPRHIITADLFMGDVAGDAASDGQPNGEATGDDADGNDDEDGLAVNACFVRGKPARLDVRATNQLSQTAQLFGWADFDSDGRFEDGAAAMTDVPAGSGAQSFALDFAQPLIPAIPYAFVRLRVSTDPLAELPTGLAQDGEIEDHRVRVVTPTLTLAPTQTTVQLGDSAHLTAAAAIPQSCADATGLSICWEGGPDANGCTPVGPDGAASITQSCTVAGVHIIRAWVDLDGNQQPDVDEPTVASTITCQPPTRAYTITLAPITTPLLIGTQHVVTATVRDAQGDPAAGQEVLFSVSGANAQPSTPQATNADGQAAFAYEGRYVGQDTVMAELAAGNAAPALATVTWYSYTIPAPTQPVFRVVGTEAVVDAKVFDNYGQPAPNQVLQFEVAGVNQIAGAHTRPTDDQGHTQIRYPYMANKNAMLTDWITATIPTADPAISFSQTFSVTWIPVAMTVQVITNTADITPSILIDVSPSVTATAELTATIIQENLELPPGQQVIPTALPFTVSKPALRGQEATSFQPEEIFVPLSAANRSNPGCNIGVADGASPWLFKLWIDLNQDGQATGEEPTCIVEAPTANTAPRFSGASTADAVVLSWSTGVEIDLLGFNLYRSTDPAGPYTLLNPNPILAVGNALGADYRYVDRPPAAALYYYQIETMTSAGPTVSDPVAILFPAPEHHIYLPLAQH
ncbi:MAG: GEVED domain-containing protein [Caldilineaceae bacterium]